MDRPHIPVMAREVVEALRIRAGEAVVDCTVGAGGHSALIAARLGEGRLLAIDRDPRAVALARERLAKFENVSVVRGNYGRLGAILAESGFGPVDGVLIDAGVSSMQLDNADRGFSLDRDGDLDMRMSPDEGWGAAQYLAETSEAELIEILRRYGDVRPARRIAAAIRRRCREGRMRRTQDLVEAVREALPFVQGEPDEVRTVFQAVRIAVNDELCWLDSGVREAAAALRSGGRLAVISFHSGEDRVVRDALRELSRPQRILTPDGRVERVINPTMRLVTAKPLLPQADEIRDNPRAKSARLRVGERI